jgi:hypothetical protein
VVLPSVGLEAVGVLLLTCTSLLLLGDISMMSSALLNVKGSPNVAGMLGVAGSLNVAESQRIAGLLRVAGSLNVAELRRVAGSLRVAGLLNIAELQRISGRAMS